MASSGGAWRNCFLIDAGRRRPGDVKKPLGRERPIRAFLARAGSEEIRKI